MGIPVGVYAKSGFGKSYSLFDFDPKEVTVLRS